MPKVTVCTKSAAETRALGKKIARVLKPGDVVLLIAGLGSGKTTFVQGAASYWGADRALSPTFILAQTLQGKKGVSLHHLDFYRVEKSDVLSFGIEDYLTGGGAIPKGVVFIEWADRFPRVWPNRYLQIRIEIVPGSTDRIITLEAKGTAYRKKLKDAKLT